MTRSTHFARSGLILSEIEVLTLGFLREYKYNVLELSESINVWAFFKNTKITPYVFFWKKRRIKVDAVNLVHTTNEGNSLIYHFSISANGNFYELAFHLSKLKWFLEAVEEE